MKPIVLERKADSDGVLRIDLPLGAGEAGREVRVTVTPLPRPMSQEEYRAWVLSMAGTWQGEFERPPQDYGIERDSFQ